MQVLTGSTAVRTGMFEKNILERSLEMEFRKFDIKVFTVILEC